MVEAERPDYAAASGVRRAEHKEPRCIRRGPQAAGADQASREEQRTCADPIAEADRR